jgi:hypothetical protein
MLKVWLLSEPFHRCVDIGGYILLVINDKFENFVHALSLESAVLDGGESRFGLTDGGGESEKFLQVFLSRQQVAVEIDDGLTMCQSVLAPSHELSPPTLCDESLVRKIFLDNLGPSRCRQILQVGEEKKVDRISIIWEEVLDVLWMIRVRFYQSR